MLRDDTGNGWTYYQPDSNAHSSLRYVRKEQEISFYTVVWSESLGCKRLIARDKDHRFITSFPTETTLPVGTITKERI